MDQFIHSIILAAGLGTRMLPLTACKPKPLLLYQGIPLVSRIINNIYPYSSSITVVTRYLSEQFEDIPYSYQKCKLLATSSNNMVSGFLEAAKLTSASHVIGISSDIVFGADVIAQAFNELNLEQDAIHVFLTRSESQVYKKWLWTIENDRLVDLKVEKTPTGYEKLFILFPRKLIVEYTDNFTKNLGSQDEEFLGHEEFNQGWIYLIHRMLENNYPIFAKVLNGQVHNINSIGDLRPIANS